MPHPAPSRSACAVCALCALCGVCAVSDLSYVLLSGHIPNSPSYPSRTLAFAEEAKNMLSIICLPLHFADNVGGKVLWVGQRDFSRVNSGRTGIRWHNSHMGIACAGL